MPCSVLYAVSSSRECRLILGKWSQFHFRWYTNKLVYKLVWDATSNLNNFHMHAMRQKIRHWEASANRFLPQICIQCYCYCCYVLFRYAEWVLGWKLSWVLELTRKNVRVKALWNVLLFPIHVHRITTKPPKRKMRESIWVGTKRARKQSYLCMKQYLRISYRHIPTHICISVFSVPYGRKYIGFTYYAPNSSLSTFLPIIQ